MFSRIYDLVKQRDHVSLDNLLKSEAPYLLKEGNYNFTQVEDEFGFSLLERLSLENDQASLEFLGTIYRSRLNNAQCAFMGGTILDPAVEDMGYHPIAGITLDQTFTLYQAASQYARGGHLNRYKFLLSRFPYLKAAIDYGIRERSELQLKLDLTKIAQNSLAWLSKSNTDEKFKQILFRRVIALSDIQLNDWQKCSAPKREHYIKSFTENLFEIEFDIALSNIAAINYSEDKKKELVQAITALKTKTVGDFQNKKISGSKAHRLAEESLTLVSNLIAIKDPTSGLDLKNLKASYPADAFVQAVKKLQLDFSWKIVIGAVIGAALGFVIGAALGAILFPPLMGAVSLSFGAKGALAGAAFFAGGAALNRALKPAPLDQVASAARLLCKN